MSGESGIGGLLIVGLIGAALVAGSDLWSGSASTGGPPPRFPPDLVPSTSPSRSKILKVAADRSGHFWLDGRTNGESFRFLVDTGASVIAFGKNDARRLGIDTRKLKFTGVVSTANGTARTAVTSLTRLEIGPFVVADVPVVITESDMDTPLLGMTFLRHLNIEIRGGTLTLSSDP